MIKENKYFSKDNPFKNENIKDGKPSMGKYNS